MDRPRAVPAWLTLTYTLLVLTLVPLFALEYGLANFLWFSNIALLATLAAIWLRSRLLASMMAVAVILPEIGWNVLFWGRLLFGWDLLGLLDYMFDPGIPLWARLFSLYHVPLPALLAWLVWRWGYDARAVIWQTVLAWIVLPVSYAVSTPWENINMVYGLLSAEAQPILPPPLPLFIAMIGFPLVVYLPTHLALRWLMSFRRRRLGASG